MASSRHAVGCCHRGCPGGQRTHVRAGAPAPRPGPRRPARAGGGGRPGVPRRVPVGIGRVPRGVHLLHPLRVPHHQPDPPGAPGPGVGRPPPVLRPPRPPPVAGLVPGPAAGGPHRPLRGRAQRGGRPAGRDGRLPGPGRELVLHHPGAQLRRPVRGPVPGAALLVPGDRGAVLPPPPPADGPGRGPTVGPGQDRGRHRRRHGRQRGHGPRPELAGGLDRPPVLRDRHPGLRAPGGRPARGGPGPPPTAAGRAPDRDDRAGRGHRRLHGQHRGLGHRRADVAVALHGRAVAVRVRVGVHHRQLPGPGAGHHPPGPPRPAPAG